MSAFVLQMFTSGNNP